jgi:hypothetical protein
MWFIWGISPYRAVNTINHGYKTNKLITYTARLAATGRPRTHLGLTCSRPCVRRLCVFVSVIYRAPVPLPACGLLVGEPRTAQAGSVRPSRGRAPNRSGRMEPSISEEGKLRARNGRLNFVLSIRLPRNRKRFLTCRKSTTRDPQLYFPSEGRHA